MITISRKILILAVAATAVLAISTQTASARPFTSAPKGGYSYGAVKYSNNAVKTPFGVAARGSAFAAPNGPVPKSGYSYGAVKYSSNAVKTPFGVAARGSAFAAPNGPVPKRGYSS